MGVIHHEYPDLKNAINRNVPLIKENIDKIHALIDNIPLEYNNIQIISSIRKDYYKKSLDVRYKELFEPIYEKIQTEEKIALNTTHEDYEF